MKTDNYVIINNRAYDPVTGLPVEGVITRAATKPQETAAKEQVERGVQTPSVHNVAQRSHTLSRRYVKRPEATVRAAVPSREAIKASKPATFSPVTLQSLSTKKAAPVQKFATAPATKAPVSRADRPAENHPITQRMAGRSLDINSPQRQRVVSQQKLNERARQVAQQQISPQPAQTKQLKPAHVLKNEAIFEAMNKEVNDSSKKRVRAKRQKGNRWARFMTVATSSLAIVLLAGYLTYLNMPNLSIRMAAVQSGVNAKYPGYRPDGYALNGPITFKDGEVSMRFAYADGDRNFTINQQKSSWDSSAVKQSIESNNNEVTTTTINGLTIYSYGGNAAWVNGGVLYTLEGDAPLSGEQIQRIATSM